MYKSINRYNDNNKELYHRLTYDKKKKKKSIKLLILLLILLLSLPIIIYIKNNKLETKKTNIVTGKYITGDIIVKDPTYISIMTKNDVIYKFKYKNNLSPGTSIKINYTGDINIFDSIQNITIKNIKTIKKHNLYSNKVLNIIDKMTIDEKIGQLLLVRVPDIKKIEAVKKYQFGGYILFRRDTDNKTKEELTSDIKSYKDVSKLPLIIAIDEEGGEVSRLSRNKRIVETPFLSPQELYEQGGFELIKEDAIKKSNLLNELGINMNLAPVADITSNKDSYIYNRTFGQGAIETSKYIETVLSTQTSNVTYVLKHFPGYSDNIDTHTNIATDNRSYDDIKDNDFKPFEAGIKSGAKAVMISHNIVTSIEDTPASLSLKIHNILREQLSFSGLIITDDLSMGAITNYNHETPYIDGILAGNNLLIVTDYLDAYNEIKKAVEENVISTELIDRLVLKTIKFKLENKL